MQSARREGSALGSPQRKPGVRGFPETQSNQLLIHAAINFWPKGAHNVFACRRRIAKILCFEIQMAILPRFQRFMNRLVQCDEIVKRSTMLLVFAPYRCLGQVAMAVARRIIVL